MQRLKNRDWMPPQRLFVLLSFDDRDFQRQDCIGVPVIVSQRTQVYCQILIVTLCFKAVPANGNALYFCHR